MIDRKQLLADLKPLLKELEADLRARCDEVSQIDADLKREYQEAKDAGRTGAAYEAWRADLITQVAAAWVLSCVFVRFLEDNELISPPRISGPLHGAGEGRGMMRARDERDVYFRSHATDTDRDYVLAVFDDLAKLPGAKDIFGQHNPVSAHRGWLSGDAAQKLIEFFQRIDKDETGELVHDFTDSDWDTRFLGDLYQDLSEEARERYALLQTPEFVEEFILDRTLDPAINEFGLEGFKLIDPACGSGHFLLGAFARILAHWRRNQPATVDREVINQALAAVHGVDLNPYAVAIARFRLLIAALRECEISQLRDGPAFQFNLACGDSLLHGAPGKEQQLLGFHELAHVYQSEDLGDLRRLLAPGKYHVVVANPPYITPKDDALKTAYRERYTSCYRQYSLAVPFMERLFNLAMLGGFVGQITTNTFTKAEFGKRLIQDFFPRVDLTHVVDTVWAYIPGHNTPTVTLFGRNRAPVMPTVRCVVGVRGEPGTPIDPSKGLVWTSILEQIDQPGSRGEYIHVVDAPRERMERHPWSIGGGGAAELKELLDSTAAAHLDDQFLAFGRVGHTGADEVYVAAESALRRHGVTSDFITCFVSGENVRDYQLETPESILFPYTDDLKPLPETEASAVFRWLWPHRTALWLRREPNGTHREIGKTWYEFSRFHPERYVGPAIGFAFVATHNHFVIHDGRKVCNQGAPSVKLPPEATGEDFLRLLGPLNCSTTCFWMKQVCFPKGGDQLGQEGARVRRTLWDVYFNFNTTVVSRLPLPGDGSLEQARLLHDLGQKIAELRPGKFVNDERASEPQLRAALERAREQTSSLLSRAFSAQEELDWQCYRLFGLIDADLTYGRESPPIGLGQRAFEVVMAREIVTTGLQTQWFERHASEPTTELPADWPADYRALVERRIQAIETIPEIHLIEQPEYKRRWSVESWESQLTQALQTWLLDHLDSLFDLDDRMNEGAESTAHATLREPRLASIAQVADMARAVKGFMQVAELYVGRMDFDVANLVGDLIVAEAVPALPILRYKASGLDKRAAWEVTWDQQRLEDAVDVHFEVDNLKDLAEALRQGGGAAAMAAATLPIEERKRQQVARELTHAAGYVAEAVKHKLNLASDTVSKPIQDAARRAKKAAVGDIPVPPKYKRADYLDGNFWRLRGKLDVPKERWVSFPYCEGEDGTLVIAWAGYDHLQLARAIAERYELAKEQEGRKLVPLLAALGQLIPWLKQWHNDLDPAYGTRMGDYFENYLAEEAKVIGKTAEEVMAWTPPEKTKTKKKATAKARRRKAERNA